MSGRPSEAQIQAAAQDPRFLAAVKRAPSEFWRERAVCFGQNSELFYVVQTTAVAEFCNVCPAVTDCLATALLNNERLGAWGGTTEHERAPMLTAAYRIRKQGAA